MTPPPWREAREIRHAREIQRLLQAVAFIKLHLVRDHAAEREAREDLLVRTATDGKRGRDVREEVCVVL